MKFVKVIKAKNDSLTQYQKKFLQWLKKYNSVLTELNNLIQDCDENIGYSEKLNADGFNNMFFSLISDVFGTEDRENWKFMPGESFDDAHFDCKNFIQKAESILKKSPKTKTENLKEEFSTFRQQIISKIKEGMSKRFVYWFDNDVDLKDGKLEIVFNVDRRFRHPDEYFDMRGIETPKELQEYDKWENELQSIIDPFVKKYNLELDIHG